MGVSAFWRSMGGIVPLGALWVSVPFGALWVRAFGCSMVNYGCLVSLGELWVSMGALRNTYGGWLYYGCLVSMGELWVPMGALRNTYGGGRSSNAEAAFAS
jgi:hypothetical protein